VPCVVQWEDAGPARWQGVWPCRLAPQVWCMHIACKRGSAAGSAAGVEGLGTHVSPCFIVDSVALALALHSSNQEGMWGLLGPCDICYMCYQVVIVYCLSSWGCARRVSLN
jgi:hypothetical protein